MALVVASHLAKTYRAGDIDVPALKDVSFDIDAGAFAAFVGPSGSGKTTLLNLVGCLDHPTTGRLTVLDTDVVAALAQRRRLVPRREPRLHLPGLQPGAGAERLGEHRVSRC